MITYFLFELRQLTHIGPDLWSMVTAAIIFLLFSQLIHLSIIGARSYGLKARRG